MYRYLAGLALLTGVASCGGGSKPDTTPAPATGQGPAASAGRAGQPAPGVTVVDAGRAGGRGGRGAAGGRGGRGGGGRGAAAPAVDSSRYVRTTPPTDATINAIYAEGMTRSQAINLAQVLFDSIGPRLINSDRYNAGQDWLVKMYSSWGITARKDQWGTWNSWKRGATHLDLIAPRTRTLEAMMLAWSPGTNGQTLEGDVITYPASNDPNVMRDWIAKARGKFVLTGAPNPTCRTTAQVAEFGQQSTIERIAAERAAGAAGYRGRAPQPPPVAGGGAGGRGGGRGNFQYEWPKTAGVAALIGTNYSNYPGVDKIFGNWQQQVPTIDVTCEDYNLLFRLAERNQGPRLRLNAESEFLGEKPVFNVLAEIKGSEKPNEYIILSAHYDSWDGGSGATDNGTGTITMMEALRIIKKIYPDPKRTVMVGHWGGEEEGLLGSRAFVADHPDIVKNLHFGWNQDNGTGRVQGMGPGPFTGATDKLVNYLKDMPSDITHWIRMGNVAPPGTGGSDHSSFQCAKAPVVGLSGLNWDYSNLTWHTNRDTFDKVMMEDLRNNATLVAMLVYEADKDPVALPHDVILKTPGDTTTINYSCPNSARSSAPARGTP